MISKITACLAAAVVIIGSYCFPLLIAWLMVTVIPGAAFSVRLNSLTNWAFFLILFSVVSWLIDLIEKWTRAQSVIFLKSKTRAKSVSLTVEFGLMTYLFSRFIEPFGIAVIIAAVTVLIGLAIELVLTKHRGTSS